MLNTIILDSGQEIEVYGDLEDLMYTKANYSYVTAKGEFGETYIIDSNKIAGFINYDKENLT